MSWLIDELNNENVKLRKENNTMNLKFNRLIKDYSQLITNLENISKEIDIKESVISDLNEKIERQKVMIEEFKKDVSGIYPDFSSRLKFLLRGNK